MTQQRAVRICLFPPQDVRVELDHKGKQLEHLEEGEFLDLAAECEMNVLKPETPER